MTGWSPHKSQQRAAARGSATVSLQVRVLQKAAFHIIRRLACPLPARVMCHMSSLLLDSRPNMYEKPRLVPTQDLEHLAQGQ